MQQEVIKPTLISYSQFLIILLLIIVFPCFILFYAMNLTFKNEVEFNINFIKTNLISYASKLLFEFQPENLLDAVIEDSLNVTFINSFNYKYLPYVSSDTINFTTSSKKIEFLANSLKKHLSSFPLAILAIGGDCKTTISWLNSNYFKQSFKLPEVFVRNLFWQWLSLHNSYVPFVYSNYYKVQKKRLLNIEYVKLFERQCRKMIETYFGDYFPNKIQINSPNLFFSPRIENKKIWFKIKAYEIKRKNKRVFLGAIAIFYAIDDIPLKQFIKKIFSRFKKVKLLLTNNVHPRFITTKQNIVGFLTLMPMFYQIKFNQNVLFNTYKEQIKKNPKYMCFLVYKNLDTIFSNIRKNREKTIRLLILWSLFLSFILFTIARISFIKLSLKQKFWLYLLNSIFFPIFAIIIFIKAFANIYNSSQIHAEVNKVVDEFIRCEASYLRYSELLKLKLLLFKEQFLIKFQKTNFKGNFLKFAFRRFPVYMALLFLRNGDEFYYENKDINNLELLDKDSIDRIKFQARVFSSRVFYAFNKEVWEKDRLEAYKRNKTLNTIWASSVIKLSENLFYDLKILRAHYINLDFRLAGIYDRSIDAFLIQSNSSCNAHLLEAILFTFMPPELLGYKFFQKIWSYQSINKFPTLHKHLFQNKLGFYNYIKDYHNNEIKLNKTNFYPPTILQNCNLLEIAKEVLAQNISNSYFIKGNKLYIAYIFQAIPYISIIEQDLDKIVLKDYYINLTCMIVFTYGLVVILILSKYLHNVFSKPIFEFVRATQQVSNGDYNPKFFLPDISEYKWLEKEFHRMCKGLREGIILKRFVPNEVLKEAEITQVLNLKAGGEYRDVAVIFSHIDNFNEIIKDFGAEKIYTFLNMYFTAMENAIISCHGSIDKYIADAIMAVFYNASNLQAAYVRAWKAACKMRKALANFNMKLKALGINEIKTGISLCYGNVVSGKIGSNFGFLNYTVIGDTVNLASRLESLRKLVNEDEIIIDAYTAKLLLSEINNLENYRILGEISVKGKCKPVLIYAFKPHYEL